jgi:uncharacterized membrane protein
MKNNFIFLTVLCVILLGVSVFFRKLAIDKIHPNQLQIIAGGIYLLAVPVWWYFLQRQGITYYDPVGIFWGILCIISATASAVLLSYLLKHTETPSFVAMAVATNPLVVFSLSVVFLGESVTVKKILGCIVTIAGLVLLT